MWVIGSLLYVEKNWGGSHCGSERKG